MFLAFVSSSFSLPRYISSFSAVQVSLLKIVGPFVSVEDVKHANKIWVVVDLVDSDTGNLFNEFWDHSTEPMKPCVRHCDNWRNLNEGTKEPFKPSRRPSLRWNDLQRCRKLTTFVVFACVDTFLSSSSGDG